MAFNERTSIVTCCSNICKVKGFIYDLGFMTSILIYLEPPLLQRAGGGSFFNPPKNWGVSHIYNINNKYIYIYMSI